MRHATRAVCICSLFWNVAHSIDFEDVRKDFEERRKEHEERYKKAKEEFRSTDSSFAILPVVMPVVMVVLFLIGCVIICCVAYRRRRWFWAMHQDQQHLVPPPLPVALGPGPVISGATIYSNSNWIRPTPRVVTRPPPAPYAPQPARVHPTDGPYTSPLVAALGPGPATYGATTSTYSNENSPIRSVATISPAATYPPQPAELYPTDGPFANLNSAPSAQPFNVTRTQ